MTFMSRVKTAWQALTAPSNNQKYYGGNTSFDLWGGFYGGQNRNGDFIATEQGVAQLYGAISGANAALNKWQDWVGGQDWVLKHKSTGDIVYDSTDTDLSDNKTIPNIVLAMRDYRRNHKHSLFSSIAFSDHLYAERYLYIGKQQLRRNVLQWVNPLYIYPDIQQGRIWQYQYTADDMQDVGYALKTSEVVYHIYRRNTHHDLRGYPPLLSVIGRANISRNVERAMLGYFANGMILGGVMMPEGDTSNLSPRQVQDLERQMTRNHKGVSNAYSWAIPPVRMTFEQFDTPDIEKHWSIIEPVRNEIMMVLQVPPQVAGDPSNANYDNAADVERGWINSTATPYLKRVANELNEDVVPYFDGGIYLEFITSKYETEDVNAVSTALSNSMVSITTAQEKTGNPVDDELDGIYIIGGKPMHKSIIKQIAYEVPIDAQPMTLQAVSAPRVPISVADTKTVSVETTHICDDTCNHSTLPHKGLFNSDSFYPDSESLHSIQRDSLKTWLRFARGRVGSEDMLAFINDTLEPYIRFAVIDRLEDAKYTGDLTALILDVFKDDTVKTTGSYRRQARSLIKKLWNGEIRTSEFVIGMSRLIEQQYTQAFEQGTLRAGKKISDLEPDEQAELRTAIEDEKVHIFDLMNDILQRDRSNGGKLSEFRNRAELWISRYDRIRDLGYAVAMRDEPLMWKRNKFKESCVDCINLDGRIYTASFWRGFVVPKSAYLNCFGTFCGCKFVTPPKGAQLTTGRKPSLQGRN